MAAAGQLSEGPVVQLDQQRPDGLVQLRQREEGPVAQCSQYPAFHHIYADLCFGLILGARTRAGMTATP